MINDIDTDNDNDNDDDINIMIMNITTVFFIKITEIMIIIIN